MALSVRHSFPSGVQDQFNVRFPTGMRDRIKAAADQNSRSMNAEIIATLADKYPAAPLDIQAVENVLHYVASTTDDLLRAARAIELNNRFAAIGSPLRIETGPDGKLIIATDF